jgi:uncharacterized phage protein (TIGR01671 family)
VREIKFRAWDGNKLLYSGGRIDQPDAFNCFFEHFPGLELQQYTGLSDKNGVPIYEGDILQREETEYYENGPGKVKDWCTVYWHNSAWFVDFHGDEILPIDDYDGSTGEVIGNIYENGDLLK